MAQTTAVGIIKKLKEKSNPRAVEGMTRYGINPKNTLGVQIPILRQTAREAGKNHMLAQQLWNTGIHEARILAGMVDEPEKVTERQMERWVIEIDSWDICDQLCSNLLDKTKYARKKAIEWSSRKEEFVKRAGFTMMACLSVHDKKRIDDEFEPFLNAIKKEADDERNYVKKAVNWALRQIGKRNKKLNKKAIQTAMKIQKLPSKSARWIAADAIRELKNEKVRKRIG
ncbi:MAG: DNA alkylation repair protein [Candidatus Altiarchaeota archaeon]|nr:DNA alkylation repair protein [Candidatus Altiarchaeota archaeon]